MGKSLILYTYHDPNFDILSDIDHSKTSMSDNLFSRAYKWLFNLIGTDQIIWSWTSEKNYELDPHALEQKLWILDVPEDKLIYINSYCWDCVINKWFWLPERFNVVDDTVDWDKEISDWENERKNFQEQDWLDNIFEKTINENTQVLIKGPIKKEWIIGTKLFSSYNKDFLDREIISEIYEDKVYAERNFQIYIDILDKNNVKYIIEKKCEQSEDGYSIRIKWGEFL